MRINLAIISCGAASVAFLRSFIDALRYKHFSSIKIILFESAFELGVGVAYQEDFDNLLINRPLHRMSVNPTDLNEFQVWLEKNPALMARAIFESNAKDDTRAYISRNVFGGYLKSVLDKILLESNRNKIEIQIVNKEVTHIHKVMPYVLQTSDGEKFFANYIVLCNGNNKPDDVYQLSHTQHYINSPYPLISTLHPIPKHHTIGIIGNSLTAIDIVVSLKNRKHVGDIFMLSRSNAYPKVRGATQEYILKIMTEQAISHILQEKGQVTLRDALRLLRMELKISDIDWRSIFSGLNKIQDFKLHIKNEILSATQEKKWQAILSATNQIIENLWNSLNFQSKAFFMKYFHRIWLCNRTPIPVCNAHALLEMAEKKQLQMISNIQNILYSEERNGYQVTALGHPEVNCNWIINATGPSRFINPNDTLMWNLLEQGLVREHHFGGLDVEFDSAALIEKTGRVNYSIRAIGHNTSGVYYYTSSLEMIAKRAHKVAIHLTKCINKEVCCD